MIIINRPLLKAFSAAMRCEWCGGLNRSGGLDPHHAIYKRGAGGGSRLDIRWNLMALCRRCHTDAEAGAITKEDSLAVISAREKVAQEDLESFLMRVRRTPKMDIVEVIRLLEECTSKEDRFFYGSLLKQMPTHKRKK